MARTRKFHLWDGARVSPRTRNIFRATGLKTHRDLLRLKPSDFEGVPNVGATTLTEIGHLIGQDWSQARAGFPKKHYDNNATKLDIIFAKETKLARASVRHLNSIDEGDPYNFSTGYTLRLYTNLGNGSRWWRKPRILEDDVVG